MASQSRLPRRIGGESIIVACFVVLTTLYLYQTFSFRRTMMSDFVGPAMFPQLVAGFALILATIYFLQLYLSRASEAGDEPAGTVAPVSALLPVAPIVLYVLILEPLGFLFSTAIYVFVAMLMFGQTWKKSLIYAATMAISFFVLFYYLLLTQVPMGWLIQTGRILPFLVQIRRAIEG